MRRASGVSVGGSVSASGIFWAVPPVVPSNVNTSELLAVEPAAPDVVLTPLTATADSIDEPSEMERRRASTLSAFCEVLFNTVSDPVPIESDRMQLKV